MSKEKEKVMVMSHKSSENKDKTSRIEEFFCTDRIEEKKTQAIRIWEYIVEKVVNRRENPWSEAA